MMPACRSILACLLSCWTAMAQADPPQTTCSAQGYDILLRNETDRAFPEGTILRWTMPFARAKGDFVLRTPLAPGHVAVLTGVLGSTYVARKMPCEVSLGD